MAGWRGIEADSRSLVGYTRDIEKDPVISVPARIVEGWDVGDRRCNLLIRLFDSHIEFRDTGHKIALGDVDLPLDELIKKRLHSGFELSVDELRKRHGRCRLQLGYPSCCQEGAHDVEILL